jgi:hypothetical protein
MRGEWFLCVWGVKNIGQMWKARFRTLKESFQRKDPLNKCDPMFVIKYLVTYQIVFIIKSKSIKQLK